MMRIWKKSNRAYGHFPDDPEGHEETAKNVGDWCFSMATYLKYNNEIYKGVADDLYIKINAIGKNYIDELKKRFFLEKL